MVIAMAPAMVPAMAAMEMVITRVMMNRKTGEMDGVCWAN